MFCKAFAGACVVAAALASAAVEPAAAQQSRSEVGTLTCSISSGVGMIIGSQRNVNCIFKTNDAQNENYAGTMTRIGLDVGVTAGGAIIWAVFADTARYDGMLEGVYRGATAEASIAVGLGANILIGGSNSTVALQPVSVQGQIGLNIAAGVGSLSLHLVPQ